MMSEGDLRELHRRVVAALTWCAKTGGVSRAQLRDLASLRIQLDWFLEIETKSSGDWAAGIFRQLHNVEDLRKHYERGEATNR